MNDSTIRHDIEDMDTTYTMEEVMESLYEALEEVEFEREDEHVGKLLIMLKTKMFMLEDQSI